MRIGRRQRITGPEFRHQVFDLRSRIGRQRHVTGREDVAIQDLLGAQPDLDAIITASASSAMAVVGALENRGLSLGQQIDVFSKEAMPFLNLFRRDILTISEKVSVTGEFLARAAIQAIKPRKTPRCSFWKCRPTTSAPAVCRVFRLCLPSSPWLQLPLARFRQNGTAQGHLPKSCPHRPAHPS